MKKNNIQELRVDIKTEIDEIYALIIINCLVSIITLGIYSFWGKTNLRKYWLSSIYINNIPMKYSGTGGELFLNYLKTLILFFFASILWLYFIPDYLSILTAIIIYYFANVGIYSATKYRLSRSSWNGKQAVLTASSFRYAFHAFYLKIL